MKSVTGFVGELRRREDRFKRKVRGLKHAEDVLYRFYRKAPVRVGEILEIEVTETTINKIGVARIGLFKISVPNASVGERVKVKIKSVSEREALAERID